MEEAVKGKEENKIIKSLTPASHPKRLIIIIVTLSIGLGILSGYILAGKNKDDLASAGLSLTTAKNPQSDTRTFRDFAEGTLRVRPQASDTTEYVEGTHMLQREGAVPVALTSSVVDLTKYEGKKVKVFGETQKALKEGWLMDVGKVEEVK